jgi:hypothetical protein
VDGFGNVTVRLTGCCYWLLLVVIFLCSSSSTGLRMPRLMGNWDHLFVRNRFADKAMQVMQRFQEKLRKLSIVIDERNPKRRFRMEAFNPVHMESSVSV